jgi:integrase/recombinase XerC
MARAQREAGGEGPLLTIVENWCRSQLLEVEGKSPHTARAYASDLRAFLRWTAARGVTGLDAWSLPVLRAYSSLLTAKGRAATTIIRKVAALRSFGRHLRRRGLIESDPAALLVLPRAGQRLPRFIPEAEIARLLDGPWETDPKSVRDRAILELFYGTGIRLSELVGLRRSDVDLSQRTARVRARDKERIVSLRTPAAAALRATSRPKRAAPPGGPLFLGREGKRLSARTVEARVQLHLAQLARAAGPPHALRHSFATHCSIEERTSARSRSSWAMPTWARYRSTRTSRSKRCARRWTASPSLRPKR